MINSTCQVYAAAEPKPQSSASNSVKYDVHDCAHCQYVLIVVFRVFVSDTSTHMSLGEVSTVSRGMMRVSSNYLWVNKHPTEIHVLSFVISFHYFV